MVISGHFHKATRYPACSIGLSVTYITHYIALEH